MNTVLTFTLSDLLTGAGRFALICPEARYASIASPGGDRLERRFVTPTEWRLFQSEVTLGLPPGPLAADHVVSRILVDERKRKGTAVQYVALQPLEFDALSAAVVLDAHLRALASRTEK
jgi:hypothetical protein